MNIVDRARNSPSKRTERKFESMPANHISCTWTKSQSYDYLVRVEAAAETSQLPAEPDHPGIEEFVYRIYRDEVLMDKCPLNVGAQIILISH